MPAETAQARPRRAAWPLVALALLGAALVLAPIALGMFDRAPRGAAMMADFRPYMTDARIGQFQGYFRDIDAAVAEAGGAGSFASESPDFAAFRREWPAIHADMGDLLGTIRVHLPDYRAIAALPSFTVFPWLFIVPGALLAALAAAGLARRRWSGALRWPLAAVGLALVVTPLALGMFQRAPAGARMMDAFRGIETRQRVETMQGYFGTMAIGEGSIRLELVPALRRSGLTTAQIARRYPAVSRLERRWIGILGDMTPMIGAMSDNVERYRALSALPAFALFPWFLAIPGVLAVGLALAPRRRRRARPAAAPLAAVTGPSRPL